MKRYSRGNEYQTVHGESLFQSVPSASASVASTSVSPELGFGPVLSISKVPSTVERTHYLDDLDIGDQDGRSAEEIFEKLIIEAEFDPSEVPITHITNTLTPHVQKHTHTCTHVM